MPTPISLKISQRLSCCSITFFSHRCVICAARGFWGCKGWSPSSMSPHGRGPGIGFHLFKWRTSFRKRKKNMYLKNKFKHSANECVGFVLTGLLIWKASLSIILLPAVLWVGFFVYLWVFFDTILLLGIPFCLSWLELCPRTYIMSFINFLKWKKSFKGAWKQFDARIHLEFSLFNFLVSY